MPTHHTDDRSSLSALDSAELRSRVMAGVLTDDEHSIAISILQERGLSIADLPDHPVSQEPAHPVWRAFISDCLHGRAPLWKAFWIFGLGVYLSLAILSVLGSIVPLANVLLALFAQAIWTVAVWRCAFQDSRFIWGVLARGWLILLWSVFLYALIVAFDL